MDVKEYLGQGEYYFSESAGQLIPLQEMPFQQAYNSHHKLLREHSGDYFGTVLHNAFVAKLEPSPKEIREQLTRYGKACHQFSSNDGWVRVKMRSAARVGKKRVKTHIHHSKTELFVGWIEAVVTLDAAVRVKGKVVS